MRRGILAGERCAGCAGRAPAVARRTSRSPRTRVAPTAPARCGRSHSPNENQSQALTGLTGHPARRQLEVEAITPTPGFTAQIVRDQSGARDGALLAGRQHRAPISSACSSSPARYGTSDGDLQLVAVQTFADGSAEDMAGHGRDPRRQASPHRRLRQHGGAPSAGVAIVLALAAAVRSGLVGVEGIAPRARLIALRRRAGAHPRGAVAGRLRGDTRTCCATHPRKGSVVQDRAPVVLPGKASTRRCGRSREGRCVIDSKGNNVMAGTGQDGAGRRADAGDPPPARPARRRLHRALEHRLDGRPHRDRGLPVRRRQRPGAGPGGLVLGQLGGTGTTSRRAPPTSPGCCS